MNRNGISGMSQCATAKISETITAARSGLVAFCIASNMNPRNSHSSSHAVKTPAVIITSSNCPHDVELKLAAFRDVSNVTCRAVAARLITWVSTRSTIKSPKATARYLSRNRAMPMSIARPLRRNKRTAIYRNHVAVPTDSVVSNTLRTAPDVLIFMPRVLSIQAMLAVANPPMTKARAGQTIACAPAAMFIFCLFMRRV